MDTTCSNCTYEVNSVDEYTGLCQTCKNAYDEGFADGVRQSTNVG